MTKTLADLLTTEAQRLPGFVYCSHPYPCGIAEMQTQYKHWRRPSARQLSIDRTPTTCTITIKPRKGTGRRKPLVIRLWSSRPEPSPVYDWSDDEPPIYDCTTGAATRHHPNVGS